MSKKELFDENGYPMNKSFMEIDLPQSLKDALEKYKNGQKKIKKGEEYWMLDCDWMELNSSINVAENDGSISSTQAWYLREKYLGMTKEDNCGSGNYGKDYC